MTPDWDKLDKKIVAGAMLMVNVSSPSPPSALSFKLPWPTLN